MKPPVTTTPGPGPQNGRGFGGRPVGATAGGEEG
jgi:hypothetical protein